MHYENGCIIRDQTFLGTSNGFPSLLSAIFLFHFSHAHFLFCFGGGGVFSRLHPK